MVTYTGLFLLSAATLTYEITLTRMFSVTQFYHFAFMVVSLALLGFGASGTFLSLFPGLKEHDSVHTLPYLSWGFALGAVGSYALTLFVPFDSFRIALDWHQGAILALHYVALALPFFCSGAATGLLLATQTERASRTYAANLIGSATGCLLAVTLPSLVGGEGTVLLSAALASLAALMLQIPNITYQKPNARPRPLTSRITHHASRLLSVALALLLTITAIWTPAFFTIRLSPYKSLSYALLLPDAELVSQEWNGFSRVDVVRSESIRSLPGRGFHCADLPPPQLSLTIDGDDPSPISQIAPGFSDATYTDCLLLALPYRLRPDAQALILEPRGGFDVLVALAEGTQQITAVEPNPLVVQAVRSQGAWAGKLYDDPRVSVISEEGRSYTRRTQDRYDIVVLSLTSPQRPITSGAYSLAEDYRYTVEAFADYVARLDDDGLLVVTRWLQVPPSESLRAFALAVEAVKKAGGDPRTDIVALRSYQQMLILAQKGPFAEDELNTIRAFASARAFDLVYLPDMRPDEANQHNIMPEPVYHQACLALLEADDRNAWYRDYSFDIAPPTDDHPFFGHFFKWRQAPDVLAMAGHMWQPFGGAGYFVLLALLGLSAIAAGTLIVMPLAVRKKDRPKQRALGATLAYFALLGVGYLCVEIPLLQRFILFLGHPAYAMAAVLFALLLFSGLGSLLSRRVRLRPVLLSLPLVVASYALGLPVLFKDSLGMPAGGRLLVAVLALAPLGLLMGMPFPKGLSLLEPTASQYIAWAWGVNGAMSVVASILAALLSLSFGFSAVLALGAFCYAGAYILVRVGQEFGSPMPHRQ